VKTLIEVDCETVDKFVVSELKDYYKLCRYSTKIDCSDDYIDPDVELLRALERVLKEYMTQEEYEQWLFEKDN
jgi:hypothetical protein